MPWSSEKDPVGANINPVVDDRSSPREVAWATSRHSNLFTEQKKTTRPQTPKLGGTCTTSYEMQDEEDQAHHKQDVNHSRADVKCEKPKQPEHNQYRCD